MRKSKSVLDRPIIVFGTGRSGTTIISEALLRHELLAFPSNYDEWFPGRSNVAYFRRIFDNARWRYEGKKKQINSTGFLNRIAFIPGESYSMWSFLCRGEVNFSRGFLLDDRLSGPTRSLAITFFEEMVRKQRRSRLALKITGPSRLGFLLDLFPNARFIRITRDAVPTISSWLKVDFWRSKGASRLWWQGAYSPEQVQWADGHKGHPHMLAAMQYAKLMEVAQYEMESTNAPVLEVPYEQFITEPKYWMKKMLNFCELESSGWIDDYMDRNPLRANERPDVELFSDRELSEIRQMLNKKWK